MLGQLRNQPWCWSNSGSSKRYWKINASILSERFPLSCNNPLDYTTWEVHIDGVGTRTRAGSHGDLNDLKSINRAGLLLFDADARWVQPQKSWNGNSKNKRFLQFGNFFGRFVWQHRIACKCRFQTAFCWFGRCKNEVCAMSILAILTFRSSLSSIRGN